ncbi:ATPase [Sphingomonas sp. So64.6b]|uniref:ATP-binding protein n=1 Tax=Sphingomonas sp. So64.6b TaxID=2997354 RepID=UPI0016022981|nr:ATP-binding protein [Sphingomonas sp. So64.6b]QNA84618.1 ATPase [Sphingomonas sp. So64.6b]
MFTGFGPRTFTAIGIVLVATAAVYFIGHSAQAALVTLIAGVAAVLAAAGTGEVAHEPAPPPPAERKAIAVPDLGEVMEAIVEPVLIVTDGRVSHANSAARALLGGHIIGEDVRLAIRHPAAAERLSNPLAGHSSRPIDLVGLGTMDQRWEMRIGRASGGQRIVHLIDQTGNYAAEKMRVDFVANASHELRTPLASILGYIETLGDEKAGEDAQVRNRFLKIMFDEARRMQRLVEDLISLSRIEAEKYRLPDRAVDLAALIGEVRTEFHDGQDGRGDIIAEIEADVPPVAGDQAQLSQVLHNLIGNAKKYGRAGAPVSVRLWRDQTNMVRISVADQGDGIAPEHIPRLTERFYRVDPGRSRAAGGTGLGLAIVKHIVERHRGRLDIASTLGKGTTVTILLPAHQAQAGAAVTKA